MDALDGLKKWQHKIELEAGTGNVEIGEIMSVLSKEQMLASIGSFLKESGYEMVPVERVGDVTPDFRARRAEGDALYELLGVLCLKPEECAACYEKMESMEQVLGDRPEYVMAAHQMPEYLLYDVLEANRGKLYIDMKERMYTMWMCYVADGVEGVWCFLGGSKDQVLEIRYSNVRQLTAEALVGPRVTDMLLEDEGF